jgi:hypothetical protein
VRRELLDHVIVLNQRHLRRLLKEYIRYYHQDRTHLGLEKDRPGGRVAASAPPRGTRITSLPRLGGLHHRYAVACEVRVSNPIQAYQIIADALCDSAKFELTAAPLLQLRPTRSPEYKRFKFW